MHRKVLSILFVFLAVFYLGFAEEDEDWYVGQPIASIEFEGLNTVKKSDLVGITSSFIDKPWTDDVYIELLDRLFALDYFDDINSYVKHDSKDPSKVLLVFDVQERPIISSISFDGNKRIRNAELRDQINIKVSDIFVESQILLDERAIRNHYLEKGYTSSSVTHTTSTRPDGSIEVNFIINEGANTVIKEIHFSGNNEFSERTLKNKITSKEVGLFKDGAYQYSTLEQDKQKIIAFYREHGYVDATILDVGITTERNEDKQRDEMIITFYIQEGAQYKYKGLTISGNENFTSEELLANLKLKVDDIYNEKKFQEDLTVISSIYYENGYMTNEFFPVSNKNTDKREISFDLKVIERPRSHVENIIIKGNTKTKENVISREIPLEPGDVFSRAKVINGLRNLVNLQYFSNVVPEPQQGSEENLVDLVVTVEEQPTSTFNFGMTFSGITDPTTIPVSLFLKVENSNLFGEGKTISAATQISNTEQIIDLSYSQNWIGNLPIYFNHTLSLSHSNSHMLVNFVDPNLNFNQNNYYSDYQGWSAAFSSGIGRRWAFDYAILSVSGGISTSLNRNNYDQSINTPIDLGVASFANRWGISNSLFANFSVDNRDVSYDPTKGWFASERLTLHGLIPKLEKEFFLRSDTKLEAYFKLLDLPVAENWSLKLVLAGYSGLTMLFPTSNAEIGDSQLLFIDGMFNGRGWGFGSNNARGEFMFSNNLELRMPLVPGVVGVDFFFDAVAIKPKMSDVGSLALDDFYFSFGPGLRFLMPQFPLHLLFTWRFKTTDGVPHFDKNPFQFVLSFNLTNR